MRRGRRSRWERGKVDFKTTPCNAIPSMQYDRTMQYNSHGSMRGWPSFLMQIPLHVSFKHTAPNSHTLRYLMSTPPPHPHTSHFHTSGPRPRFPLPLPRHPRAHGRHRGRGCTARPARLSAEGEDCLSSLSHTHSVSCIALVLMLTNSCPAHTCCPLFTPPPSRLLRGRARIQWLRQPSRRSRPLHFRQPAGASLRARSSRASSGGQGGRCPR